MLELIVVMAIFLIITVVVVADIPNFRQKSSLDLTVSEVSTYVRGAQVYGASQKGGESTNLVFGISFSKDSSDFFLFKDAKTLVEERYEMPGFYVSEIKIFSSATTVDSESVDIIFRANNYIGSIGTQLEPLVYVDYEGGGEIFYNQASFVEIKISSKRGNGFACLRIYNNGQITPATCEA